ncbi:Uncharacterised protein [Klebsiella quasipneumoniae]|nr:Uncharacterised protein [Klebsiella quasipneumoniae]VGG09964.1 Uncharacterised protein [Klebsiella quasipneumoniae]
MRKARLSMAHSPVKKVAISNAVCIIFCVQPPLFKPLIQ